MQAQHNIHNNAAIFVATSTTFSNKHVDFRQIMNSNIVITSIHSIGMQFYYSIK